MGFTLRITNPPSWAVWWIGLFTDLFIASPALPIDEVWDCPDNPLGHETLVIQLFDVNHNLLFQAIGLGPVYSGKDYEYNYATGAFYEVVLEEYVGAISKRQLEDGGTYTDIPAYNVPQGESVLVHVWGRNDMATSQKLGITWIVFDPDEKIVESYSDWEFGTTGPDGDHHFIGDRFNLDKPGTYFLSAMLLMNPDSPVIVDEYHGNLCTVKAVVPEPEFSGFSITEYTA